MLVIDEVFLNQSDICRRKERTMKTLITDIEVPEQLDDLSENKLRILSAANRDDRRSLGGNRDRHPSSACCWLIG
jgi:hypothetical protein